MPLHAASAMHTKFLAQDPVNSVRTCCATSPFREQRLLSGQTDHLKMTHPNRCAIPNYPVPNASTKTDPWDRSRGQPPKRDEGVFERRASRGKRTSFASLVERVGAIFKARRDGVDSWVPRPAGPPGGQSYGVHKNGCNKGRIASRHPPPGHPLRLPAETHQLRQRVTLKQKRRSCRSQLPRPKRPPNAATPQGAARRPSRLSNSLSSTSRPGGPAGPLPLRPSPCAVRTLRPTDAAAILARRKRAAEAVGSSCGRTPYANLLASRLAHVEIGPWRCKGVDQETAWLLEAFWAVPRKHADCAPQRPGLQWCRQIDEKCEPGVCHLLSSPETAHDIPDKGRVRPHRHTTGARHREGYGRRHNEPEPQVFSRLKARACHERHRHGLRMIVAVGSRMTLRASDSASGAQVVAQAARGTATRSPPHLPDLLTSGMLQPLMWRRSDAHGQRLRNIHETVHAARPTE